MPWNELTIVNERMRFILEHASGDYTMSALCRRFGISRPTGYKWVERYSDLGVMGLQDRSSAPLDHGRRLSAGLEDLIVSAKTRRPNWGPKKIRTLIVPVGEERVPSASTIGAVLKRHGLVKARWRRRRVPPGPGPLTQADGPNHVWSADHKGWVTLGDGHRLEPLTVTDNHSRYLIALAATGSTAHDEVKPLFDRAFCEHGLPDVIRADNGVPFFASAGVTGLSRLSAHWARLGIGHERIEPGKPQQNGRHERFHLTLKEAMAPPPADRIAARAAFERFRLDYNLNRPHEALGQSAPANHYQLSPRPMPASIKPPEYPDGAIVRRVRSNGEIKWQGELVYVAQVLIGELVALTEDADGIFTAKFYQRPIGRIAPKGQKLMPFSRSRQAAEKLDCKQPNRSEL